MKDKNIIALVTFALFSTEAYGHYLIARNEGNEKFKWYKPSRKAIFDTMLLVGGFSILNDVIITELKKL